MKIPQAGVSNIPNQVNPNVGGRSPSATLAMNEKLRELRVDARKIYGFGFGQSPFPIPRAVVEALRANASRGEYLAVKGLQELREAVASYHGRLHDIEVRGEDILVGPGSKELLFLAQFVYPADLVLPAPCWVSYAPQAQLLGRSVFWLQTQMKEAWRLLPGELQKLCAREPAKPRILVLNYPNNPTGLTYEREHLETLGRVARRYGILVISDEIYGEFHHAGRHVSMAQYYPEGTIVSSGLSKWCSAGGWRLGTFAFPRSLRWMLEAMACVASETYSTASAPVQFAAVRAYEGGSEMERYLFQARRILRALGRWACRRFNDAGVEVETPAGAFYLFPSFARFAEQLHGRGIATGADLCERLLAETGVAILPGSEFGRPITELSFRLAYVDFDGQECLAAAEKVSDETELEERFLQKHCGNVVAGIDVLCDWLKILL